MEHGSPSSNHNRSTASSSVIFEKHVPPKEGEEVNILIVHLTRIMRRALPRNAKINNGAKESIQLCVSEFMGIITTKANERCKAEHRKIITADDLIWAMEKFGFDDYVGPLKLYLKNYRDHKDQTGDI
ncbi:nuclear transcription factor Y subunit B-6-like [Trifolium pratense]|uniref:nuclear transcription factor Y subunit B-6-like n=1 Tax=Trifolium pratense TaxID=57577 RepID=UPI001E695EBA|nr:nuclear transcription factor Y subunit B-6-like [Trifolium pratense]